MLQPRLFGCALKMSFWSFVCVGVLLSSALISCQEINNEESIEATRIKRDGVSENRGFNTNGIVFDNSPWRPGREMDLVDHGNSEDERRFKNLATKVLSNGVEVLVKDKNDGKHEQTKYMEVKTIKPSSPSKIYQSNFVKIEKKIDNDNSNSFDLIQPSEVAHTSCTSSCSCSHTKTESLKTMYSNVNDASAPAKYGMKTSKYDSTKLDVRPTNKEILSQKTKYNPYEYETGSQVAPTDKVVEKYTEVINDYSDEKDSNSVEESELLTNEQAPVPPKPTKAASVNKTDKHKLEKPQKPNKNKFVVADLLKLGSLGIKGLSQLAPVLEKMTGGFIKRQENRTSTTTVKPVSKLTAYSVDKRIDTDMETKSNFPIYIPVDELETSESQIAFTNATLHQSLAWAAEHKQPKARIVPPKMIHESPLVNGGIPISPGEIITANSDVIVGRPAIGGPLTLAASGIKLQNPVNPPTLDSIVSGDEQYLVQEKPPVNDQNLSVTKVDDSFDLRPPELPKPKNKPNRNPPRHSSPPHNYYNSPPPKNSPRPPMLHGNDHGTKAENTKPTTTILGNHGRPAFLDYIPSLARPENLPQDSDEVLDNSPSSSEVISTRVRVEDGYQLPDHNVLMSKPFLVDIQPSRVANVLIPHGSSTALVFAGSSEPHKTGDYVDDPLPYPEPGYFGSFSIDAPQMTNVHNVAPNSNKHFASKPTHRPLEPYKPHPSSYKNHTFKSDQQIKWKDSKSSFDYNKIPPPTSNQETFLQVGPQITAYNPNIYHHNNGDFEHYSHVRGKEKQKEIIDNEYENYLAVPPPPPKMHFNHENNFDKNKPYLQKPIVHTKPVQDMKVFLNIQHPVPNAPQKDQQPPKITSEIYFAAQIPSSKPTPVYTVRIPPAGSSYSNSFNQAQNESPHSDVSVSSGHIHGSVLAASPPTYGNKSITNNGQEKDGTYTVTLNTATNVASNVGDSGQVIGSSVPVTIGTASKYGDMNTNIPISTNFAIRVEDDSTHLETYNHQNKGNTQVVYDYGGPEENRIQTPIKVSMGDNRWNTSSLVKEESVIKHEQNNYYKDQNIDSKPVHHNNPIPSISSSQNSHANFPMLNDFTTPKNVYENIKPVTEYQDEIKSNDQKRPAKLIPNIPTNSHGWYSSVPLNENTFNSINNIKVESTTRKIIPLLHDYNKDSLPNFGQKITSVGKPPSGFWSPEKSTVLTHHGKPFTKPNDHKFVISSQPPVTPKPLSPNYIPSNFDAAKQPTYDIPIRDNSDETTTAKYTRPTAEKNKPIFENSEEIYDGEEDSSNSEIDEEVSQESMKVPVVSTSAEIEHTSKSTTQLVLLRDEVIENSSSQSQKDANVNLVDFNPGTQTEKPFGSNNKTTFTSNTIKPIYNRNPYMQPRPFTVNTITTLDHQLHQPHWQINQMLENSTNVSYEENLELNTGEEMSTVSTAKPSTTRRAPYYRPEPDNRYKRPPRPVFSARPNNTVQLNDPNIITSTVQIQDKKPLVVEKPNEKTTLPSFTITTDLDINRTSSEIIDLSPPPPTMDYSFKPSTNDEMIMGMSPPPPRIPPAIRHPVRTTPKPIRTPPSYKTLPPRTFPPRPTTQRITRKPITRDEISTYRPAYDIHNNIKRPAFNRYQPSSQLLPPPREPSRVVINEEPTEKPTPPNVIFPTPVSSGWLTSSGVEFASDFEFEPTSIQFPETTKASQIPELHDISSTESSLYETESSGERIENISSEKPTTQEKNSDSSKEATDQNTSVVLKEPASTESVSKESQEDVSTERIKFGSGGYRNRTRKPYPSRDSTNKYKVTTKPTSTTKPTRSRPEILYPTRPTPAKKIPQIRPIPQRPVIINPSSIIESSESSVEEDFIKPTEVLKDNSLPSILQLESSNVPEKVPPSVFVPGDENIVVKPTHHAGNEVKVFDEIIPTKTEFRTTVVTLTKTLSEPPQIISSIGYVNLTHTLTVTHTKTSLVSQSEGAVTQTLILTNTHTSTIVDVVTEVYTQVQPTTIIETVTKHIPVKLDPTPVVETTTKTKLPLDDVTMSSEESDNFIIKDSETTENVQKIQTESDNENDTFFVVMNKSQNGGQAPPVQTEIETGDYDGITINEQVSNGVSQVFGEILLAGTPYLETTDVGRPTGYGKECQPDCKASRNERCQRIDGLMKCVCRPGFARMFPDRPCKPTYTYSVKLALATQGNERLQFHDSLADNSSKQYQALAFATHEGINRMVMQSDLRDVFHGVHITGFHPVEMRSNGELFQGVMNDFYVQLSDNAHESRLKEVIEKYLRHNNYSLGGTDVHAAGELVDKLEVNDFDECLSGQFHDCSEHSQCFNLRGTYTCSCLEGYADLSVNSLYPGRICSAEPVGCERCNYHGACYSRDDRRVLCECFQWYAGSTCHINLKVVLISLVVVGALLTVVLAVCAVVACSRRPRPPPRSIVACIQSMPGLHQGAMPSKQRADRRALISERADSGDTSSVQNASLPYMPAKRPPGKKCVMSEPPAHDPPPPPAPAVMIPRARLHPHHSDSRENIARKKSLELSSEAKLISYLESGAANNNTNEEMRRKHSMESSYSAMKERHNKQGALVSAGFKVSTTIRPDEQPKDDRDDLSSVHKDIDDMRFDSLRKSYSQEDLSEWTDAERRIGELTLSEARSVGGTLPASTGRAASSTRLTHQEAHTMAERDLGSTFLLPHVHLYKPDLTSDVSEFDSL
ncbi:uncharacterized protein isoform X1 [Choristoneura fumiferana]|uniref:uncharacterized protein isoform X1 n=2 Tax=Choristoneura fumiferana TaxID=7141 RepID=UPI003D154460